MNIKLGLDSLSTAKKYSTVVKHKGGVLNALIPKPSAGYLKTIPTGLTPLGAVVLSAGMHRFDDLYLDKLYQSPSSANSITSEYRK